MTRTEWSDVLAIVLTVLWPAPASAQTTVQYYHLDAVGSVRMITDQNGAVVAYHDYLPFGIETPTPMVADPRAFAGHERDQETGLDYLGARYYASQTGRFTSPDPMTGNALRVPQRWNRYAYALNNPLRFGDPDGLDVIVFNFVNGANGNGHLGIMAVNTDGSAVYGGFNPRHSSVPFDSGRVVLRRLAPDFIRFENGRPTADSWARLDETIGAAERQTKGIRHAYYVTTAAETTSLTQFITATEQSSSRYNVFGNNCQWFCIQGLRSARIDAPTPRGLSQAAPNVYFNLSLLDLASRLALQPSVTTSETYCVPAAGRCP